MTRLSTFVLAAFLVVTVSGCGTYRAGQEYDPTPTEKWIVETASTAAAAAALTAAGIPSIPSIPTPPDSQDPADPDDPIDWKHGVAAGAGGALALAFRTFLDGIISQIRNRKKGNGPQNKVHNV